MLVFFGIANVFLGLLALDAANQNVAYTQSFKVAYGVVVALMIMMYMLFQPRAAAFKVRPPRRALSLSSSAFLHFVACSEANISRPHLYATNPQMKPASSFVFY